MLILVTLLVSHSLTSNEVNALHSLNILFIRVTLLVSNLLTSISVSNLHSWNIRPILVTLLVSKLSKPFIVSSFTQALNISPILVTLLVSHPCVLTDVKFEQLLNKLLKLVQDEVTASFSTLRRLCFC